MSVSQESAPETNAAHIDSNSRIHLENCSIHCDSDEIDIDAIRLLISIEDSDEGSVHDLQKVSSNEWRLGGNVFWISQLDAIRLSFVHEVESRRNVVLGSIDITRDMLKDIIQQNDSNAVLYLLNAQGIRTHIVLSFKVVPLQPEEDQEEKEINDLSELLDALLAIPNEPRKAGILNYQGGELVKRFQDTNDKEMLDAAILHYRVASESLSADDPRCSAFKHDIHLSLLTRYEVYGEIEDLDEGISILQGIVNASSNNDEEKHVWIMNLGSAFLRRFVKLGDVKDLTAAITNQKLAISLLHPNHPDKAGSLVNLASSLVRLFECRGNPKDLEKSISALDEALLLSPDEIVVLPPLLTTLGLSLMRQSELKHSAVDLDRAIDVQRKAVSLLPDGHEDIPRWSSNLGLSLLTRYEYVKDVRDLEESIEVQRKALKLTHIEHQNMSRLAGNLGTALMARFTRSGSLSDIEESIALIRQTIIEDNNVTDKWSWMVNLGGALYSRYKKLGNLADIEEAISVQQKIVTVVGENVAGMSTAYSELSMFLLQRFYRTRDLNDIDEAIEAIRHAIDLTPAGHQDVLTRKDFLGVCLTARFERAKIRSDIDEAIQLQRTVIENTIETALYYMQYLVNFTASLLSKYEVFHDMKDVIDAIFYAEKAIQLTAADDDTFPGRLSILGRSLLEHFQQSHEVELLQRAIATYQRAVDLTPNGHVAIVQYLSDLGDAYYLLYENTNNISQFHEAMERYKGASLQPGPPYVRLNSARTWAWSSKMHGFYSQAFEAYAVCFSILPELVSLGQTISNRHIHLRPLSTLATEAAAIAITLNKHTTAVEWLEQGRNIVWSQLNNLRLPIDDVRDAYPELAQKMDHVSQQLQRASSRTQAQIPINSINQRISLQDEVIEHQSLAKEWENLINDARQLPGFESFLRQPQFIEIAKKLPKSGPAVIINVDDSRCDALVVYHGAEDAVHIPLPLFDVKTGEHIRQELETILIPRKLLVRDILQDTRSGKKAVNYKQWPGGFETVLKKLWQLIARSILNGLNISSTDNPQRLWWCTTGVLSFLPIHAAGLYSQAAMSTSQRVPDLVISSYTPTLGALIEEASTMKSEFKGLLAICQPNTPNLPPIPKTEIETEVAVTLLREDNLRSRKLSGTAATYDAVSQEMGDYSWIHFACHALQNNLDPTKSAIYLYDGQLTISDIIQKPLTHADFAFLSACQTATGDKQLSEEAVHLAAGMLTAGYKSIIASMWSISDEYAPMVSESVYRYILRNRANGESPNSALSAEALHFALATLRSEGRLRNTEDESFLSWVPFIHIGR